MKKLNKKGFTLTEMIVVIAIIGILAAVLIPSVIGYVRHARKSNDTQVAASMTDELERYCIENNIDQDLLIGTDVRTILKAKGYNLVPSSDNWTYVYNAEEKVVEIVSLSLKGEVKLDAFTPVDPTNIAEQMYLVGEGDTPLEEAIKLLLNFKTQDDYTKAMELVDGISNSLNHFDPAKTLYVNNIKGLSTPTTTEMIVFTVGTYNVPNLTNMNLTFGEDINFNIPSIITSVNEHTLEKMGYVFNNLSDFSKPINYPTIDLSGLELSNDTENPVNPKFTFGDLVNNTTDQTISIDIVGYVTNSTITIDENGSFISRVNEVFLQYEVTVIYYGENGIVAKGTKTLYSKVDDDYVESIKLTYSQVDYKVDYITSTPVESSTEQ